MHDSSECICNELNGKHVFREILWPGVLSTLRPRLQNSRRCRHIKVHWIRRFSNSGSGADMRGTAMHCRHSPDAWAGHYLRRQKNRRVLHPKRVGGLSICWQCKCCATQLHGNRGDGWYSAGGGAQSLWESGPLLTEWDKLLHEQKDGHVVLGLLHRCHEVCDRGVWLPS